MRKILFRGKGKHDERWVYGGIVNQKDNYGDAVNDWYIIDSLNTCDYDIGEATKVIPETVGQYTGFFDRHGERIFENDIILGTCSKSIGYVVWANTLGKFIVVNSDEEYMGDLAEFTPHSMQIIGNLTDDIEFLVNDDE